MPTQCPECDAWIYEGECVICGWVPPKAVVIRTEYGSNALTVRPTEEPQLSEEDRARFKALIQGIVEKLDASGITMLRAALGSKAPATEDCRVIYHADRLIMRGLEPITAYRQAICMVEDKDHRQWCTMCHGNDAEIPTLAPKGRWKKLLGPVPPMVEPEILTENNIQARIRLGIYRKREE